VLRNPPSWRYFADFFDCTQSAGLIEVALFGLRDNRLASPLSGQLLGIA